ncbi:MAG: cell division protein FtsB [Chromatiales bacterium]|nr:cell division protein FtsB [Chromatiales bacterium]
MRLLTAFLLILLLVLQYRLWVGEGSLAEVYSLKREIAAQREELERLEQRNRALQAEVDDLKKGVEAIEARARNELGMIRENETFYQIIEKPADEHREKQQ